jgi:hypothetical protein
MNSSVWTEAVQGLGAGRTERWRVEEPSGRGSPWRSLSAGVANDKAEGVPTGTTFSGGRRRPAASGSSARRRPGPRPGADGSCVRELSDSGLGRT